MRFFASNMFRAVAKQLFFMLKDKLQHRLNPVVLIFTEKFCEMADLDRPALKKFAVSYVSGIDGNTLRFL